MEKQLFHYLASMNSAKQCREGDVIIVTKSTMPEMYGRAVYRLSFPFEGTSYFEILYNPLYLFRVKSLKPKINNNDHIPRF